MNLLWIVGAALLWLLVYVPGGSVLDWAREEIKSKPKNVV
jgi:hypothetical protein